MMWPQESGVCVSAPLLGLLELITGRQRAGLALGKASVGSEQGVQIRSARFLLSPCLEKYRMEWLLLSGPK